MSDWNYLNRYRVRNGMFASDPADGCNGYFCLTIFGERVKVIASDGEGWVHVSVSLADKPTVVPNYKTMCAIKDLFFEDEDTVVQFHPKKSEYVNDHPGCLHLWKLLTAEFPTPPPIMVGITRKY